MTDGIIQRVCKKWLDNYQSFKLENTPKLIENIQQDLISELHKLNKHPTRHNGQQFIAVSLRALIGDNKT